MKYLKNILLAVLQNWKRSAHIYNSSVPQDESASTTRIMEESVPGSTERTRYWDSLVAEAVIRGINAHELLEAAIEELVVRERRALTPVRRKRLAWRCEKWQRSPAELIYEPDDHFPKSWLAAEDVADRRDISPIQLEADLQERMRNSKYPGPDCIQPGEIEEFREGRLLEDRVAHLDACHTCYAMCVAALPKDRQAEYHHKSFWQRFASTSAECMQPHEIELYRRERTLSPALSEHQRSCERCRGLIRLFRLNPDYIYHQSGSV